MKMILVLLSVAAAGCQSPDRRPLKPVFIEYGGDTVGGSFCSVLSADADPPSFEVITADGGRVSAAAWIVPKPNGEIILIVSSVATDGNVVTTPFVLHPSGTVQASNSLSAEDDVLASNALAKLLAKRTAKDSEAKELTESLKRAGLLD